jgi:uncharacterized protein Smg (DUF494 family)
MIIDISTFDPEKINKAIPWLNETVAQSKQIKDEKIVLNSDKWRIYAHETSIEGFYETRYFIEFDDASDGTAFLLRWS